MDIFISEILKPTDSIVGSETLPVSVRLPDMLFGDTIPTNIFIVNGDGGFSDNSGAENYLIKVGVGFRGQTVAWLDTDWTQITDGWEGVIELLSAELLALFNGQNSIVCTFEVKLEFPSLNTQTLASVPFNLISPVIENEDEETDMIQRNGKTLNLVSSVQDGITVLIEENLVTLTGVSFSQIPTSIVVAINIPSSDAGLFPAVTIKTSITSDGFQFVMGGLPDNDSYTFTFVPIYK
jgi:hypothetical protein